MRPFFEFAPGGINSIRSPTDKKGKARLREAHVFITKHELHAWVTTQNDDHGIAPTVGDTFIHRDELSADKAGEAGEASIWSVASSARYEGAATFRRKWRLRSQMPHAREVVPVHAAREKVFL